MGQWYVVDLRIKPLKNRENNLCEALLKYLEGFNGRTRKEVKPEELEKLDGKERLEALLDIIYPDLEDLGMLSDGKKLYESSFDASYSWETVICDVFCLMAPYLRSGSSMTVWPDSGKYTLKVRKGQVA